MKRKIFVNGDMTGKGIPKLAVLQYKKDKFEGYIYGDTKNISAMSEARAFWMRRI